MKTETTFRPLADAFKHDAAYWGERHDWLVVYTRHRDSDTLTESNWRCFIRELGGTGTEGEKGSQDISEQVAVEEARHWAVGWVQYLLVHPGAPELIEKAQEIVDKLDDYPVIDEQDWSELEDEERQQCWQDFSRRVWYDWFDKQFETEEYAEEIKAKYKDTVECFLYRAYESCCMGHGESGMEPADDLTLERAWYDSEMGWWPEMKAFAEELNLEMKK